MLAAVFLAGAYLILNAQQYHNNYLRSKVGSKVVMITNKEENSGGTGFFVKAPSGDTYILTNAHVCSLGRNNLFSHVNNGRQVRLNVIEVSSETDLCILSSFGNIEGLNVASNVAIGEELALAGHPKLMPLTVSNGQLIGYSTTVVLYDNAPCPETLEGPFQSVPTRFGEMCVGVIKEAGMTNILSLPGNSGSPIVNFFGNVVGVLFAGGSDNWGIIVGINSIKHFLQPY